MVVVCTICYSIAAPTAFRCVASSYSWCFYSTIFAMWSLVSLFIYCTAIFSNSTKSGACHSGDHIALLRILHHLWQWMTTFTMLGVDTCAPGYTTYAYPPWILVRSTNCYIFPRKSMACGWSMFITSPLWMSKILLSHKSSLHIWLPIARDTSRLWVVYSQWWETSCMLVAPQQLTRWIREMEPFVGLLGPDLGSKVFSQTSPTLSALLETVNGARTEVSPKVVW